MIQGVSTRFACGKRAGWTTFYYHYKAVIFSIGVGEFAWNKVLLCWLLCGLFGVRETIYYSMVIVKSVTISVAKIHSLRIFCESVFDTHLLDTAQTTNLRHISWSRPAEGTVCLNVDGSLLGSVNTAGFGGLLRDNAGDFLGGFYGVLFSLMSYTLRLWQFSMA
jgi:hypothetical protein